MEIAYLKHKNGEEFSSGNQGYNNFQPTYNEPQGRTQLRSRSQVSSLQNNYKNILNDFNGLKSLQFEGGRIGYDQQSDLNKYNPPENKHVWSGKKIVQAPGKFFY